MADDKLSSLLKAAGYTVLNGGMTYLAPDPVPGVSIGLEFIDGKAFLRGTIDQEAIPEIARRNGMTEEDVMAYIDRLGKEPLWEG